jgi:hypothetical protein
MKFCTNSKTCINPIIGHDDKKLNKQKQITFMLIVT